MKRLILFGLLLVLIAGCVDYEEELWLNKDGSGRVKMVIGALTTYENLEELNRYIDQPGISLIKKSVYRKKNYTYYNLDFKFNSLESFNNLNDQISNADFFGRISLTKEKDGSITMRRRIALGTLSSEGDEIEQIFSKLSHNNLTWKYKMHLPWKIVKSNAAPANIDLKSNMVSWEYQTSYLWNKPQTMTVNLKPTFPILPILLIGFALVIVVISLIWWRRHIKKMLSTPEKIPEQELSKE